MNFFSTKSAAERYAFGRPYFHPRIIDQIKEYLCLREVLPTALDVGCGTGLSTIALQTIAKEIVGVDLSDEMIALAPEVHNIKFLVSSAENLPFDKNKFDLITLSQVFHWLDREKFLKEAHRALRAGGWLAVYDNYFSGQMEGNSEFEKWFRNSYLKNFPTPPRVWASFTADDTKKEGFLLLNEVCLENKINFSTEALTDYLVTQSNIIAAVEEGNSRINEVKLWLMNEIKPFYEKDKEKSFLYKSPLWILQCVV